jgi:hypothetical protein
MITQVRTIYTHLHDVIESYVYLVRESSQTPEYCA